MAKKAQHVEEEGGESVGLWYVSFADMITLLLSFFVMLTTFSSYSKAEMSKFAGAWASVAEYSVFSGKHSTESMAPPAERNIDWTEKGSEKPTQAEPKPTKDPKGSEWASSMAQAYHNRRVLRIVSSKLFWAEGTVLTPVGRNHLKLLASFIREVPCQVLIGESVPSAMSAKNQRGLDRGYALIDYFCSEESLAPGQMALTSPGSGLADSNEGQRIVEIVLLSRSTAHE